LHRVRAIRVPDCELFALNPFKCFRLGVKGELPTSSGKIVEENLFISFGIQKISD